MVYMSTLYICLLALIFIYVVVLISNAIMIMIWHLDKLLVELTLDNKRLLLSIYLPIMSNPC